MTSRESSGPAVSVIIPAYNTAEFIGPAIDSVLAQTFADYEIIVVNDGSPDTPALEAVLEPYLDRIRYIHQDNRGPAAARNRGIESAHGEFIGFLDGDDLWMPRFLEAHLELLRGAERPDVVYADALLIGDSPDAGESIMQHFRSCTNISLESLLDKTCIIPTSTVVARRQTLLDVGLFHENYRCCEDFDLWLRLAHAGASFAYRAEILAKHREHGGSITFQPGFLLHAQISVLTALRRDLSLSPREETALGLRVARCEALSALQEGKHHLLKREYREARHAVSKANAFFGSRRLQAIGLILRFVPGVLRFVAAHRRRADSPIAGTKS